MKLSPDKLKSARVARGWTQAELARRAEVSRRSVESWEQGWRQPRVPALFSLARVLKLSVKHLLTAQAA